MPVKVTTQSFIAEAKQIHKENYIYEKTIYTHSLEPLIVTCSTCKQDFKILKYNFLKGSEPCSCHKDKRYLDSFILRAKTKFPNFDYTNTNYNKSKQEVNIYCSLHEEFTIATYHFLNSEYGCPSCGREATRIPYEVALQRSIDTHQDTYIYGDKFKNSYKSFTQPAIITCKLHGEFKQTPKIHSEGNGCKECNYAARRLPVQEFINKAKLIHNNKYTYDAIFIESYNKAKDYVSILCPIHGRFDQWAYNHLQGRGCWQCSKEINVSKAEIDLREWLITAYPYLEYQYNVYPDFMFGYELDIYIPELKLAIEYNGYVYHSSKYKSNTYHQLKYNLCKDNSISLIHIFEFEDMSLWKDKIINYIDNKEDYVLTFDNTPRDIKGYTCYGISDIIPIQKLHIRS